ncbi:hypothetical protein NPIL_401001 [Nephila pilipes]|uniref:Uncharacterized protein n=1 Tax=Nephila pilipes TaxID=299642 RepID=A0A8X6PY57_NEPPI|nr:hypothetical protein NPIL_401001 [Nephila pilipes]
MQDVIVRSLRCPPFEVWPSHSCLRLDVSLDDGMSFSTSRFILVDYIIEILPIVQVKDSECHGLFYSRRRLNILSGSRQDLDSVLAYHLSSPGYINFLLLELSVGS